MAPEPCAVDPAAWIELAGIRVPLHFGEPDLELEAARRTAAIGIAPWRALFHVSGDDRIEFLHRVTTADIRGIPEDDGGRAMLLTPKGKVVGLLDLFAAADAVLGACDNAACDDILTGLARYVLRAPVEIVDERSLRASVLVVGPRAAEVLAAAGAGPPGGSGEEIGGRAVRSAKVAEASIVVTALRWLPVGGVEIRTDLVDADAVRDALLVAGAPLAVRPLGWATMERLRIEALIPASGTELTGAELPQEAGLEGAIDFDKGCYPGQEVVARVHYRGRVNRVLVGLDLDSIGVEAGAALEDAGVEVGAVTSVLAVDGIRGLGLGYVRTAAAVAGKCLKVAGSAAAAVVHMPVPEAGTLGGGKGTPATHTDERSKEQVDSD